MLIVNPKNARLFSDLRTFGMMCPYVIIQCGEYECRTKTHSSGGMNPEWNEFYTFDVEGDQVTFTVWDEGTIYDSKIGTYTLMVSDLKKDVVFENWMKLVYEGDCVGELFLEITYVDKTSKPDLSVSTSTDSNVLPIPTPISPDQNSVSPMSPQPTQFTVVPTVPVPTPQPAPFVVDSNSLPHTFNQNPESPYPEVQPPNFSPITVPSSSIPTCPQIPTAYPSVAFPQPVPSFQNQAQFPGIPLSPGGYSGPTFTPLGSDQTFSLDSIYGQQK